MARAPRPPRPPTPARLTQAAKVSAALAKAYPDAKCSLDYATPLQLLIATILSAQCTDARVNQVTPALFQRFPDVKAFATAPAGELERMIQSTGFFRNKARSIREVCAGLVARHAGEVPRTLEELTALRGIGRKTANVVLGNAYGIPGIVVDTHVIRVSQRLGGIRGTPYFFPDVRKESDGVPRIPPEKIEQDLMALLPKEDWVVFGHRMIYHGRKHCKAPTPQCFGCPLLKMCPYPKKNRRPGSPLENPLTLPSPARGEGKQQPPFQRAARAEEGPARPQGDTGSPRQTKAARATPAARATGATRATLEAQEGSA